VESLTTTEAFEAMRSFVAQFAAREPAESRERFRFLLHWTEMQVEGVTADPAQWDDWSRSVAEARSRLADDRTLDIP